MRIRVAAAVFALVTVVATAWAMTRAERQQKVLSKLTTEPDVLVNVPFPDLPSTTDMIQLGRPATPAIINGLINSMDSNVRGACAAVLTATRDPDALSALVDALEDPEVWVRSLAIQALGQVEGADAAKHLLPLLDNDRLPGHLQDQAVRALGRLGDPRAIKPLMRRYEKKWDFAAQSALWDLRRHLSPRQVSDLVVAPIKGKWADVPGNVFGRAVELAGELKVRAAVGPLMKRFDQAEAWQNSIVHALGKIGDKRAAPFLRKQLDRSAQARLLNNVVFALQRLGEDPKPFLSKLFEDRRAYIRFNAAFVAGDLKEKGLVSKLSEGLKDRNDYVRSEVAVALGKIGDPNAIPALEGASQEDNPIVRRDALLALAKLDYKKYRDRVLNELVTSRLESVRSRATEFLAGQNDPEMAGRIVNALNPVDWRERQLGLGYLDQFWQLDSEAVTGWLMRVGASDGDRTDAFRLLARLKDERARFALRQWLNHPQGEQNQLLRAMGRYQDQPSAEVARHWLKSKSVATQLHAHYLLAQVGDDKSLDALIASIETAPLYLKRNAARLLTELDPKKLPGVAERLESLLKHRDVYVRIYASRALIEAGGARATPAYAALWSELEKRIPFIRDEVLDVVERAPKSSREAVMGEWLARADPQLRRELLRIRQRNP